MIQKFTLFVLAMISMVQVWSQGNQVTSDPAAKKVLDAVSAQFKKFKAVQASFTLKVEDAKGKLQGSKKGTISMKGPKYRVSITGQEIFCDGKSIWTFDKSSNEVTLTTLDPNGNGLTPQKMFTNFYDKDFLYKLNGEKKEGARSLQEIELTPTDKSKNFFKVYLWIDKKLSAIYSTSILEKSGNRFSYTMNTLNGNAKITDDLFVFDKSKYPGVELVDLR